MHSSPTLRTSRPGSQSSEHRLGSAFSWFAERLNRDKFTSDGENEADDFALCSSDDMKTGPAAYEGKEKAGRGRAKVRDFKGKSKGKSREKSKKHERECTTM